MDDKVKEVTESVIKDLEYYYSQLKRTAFAVLKNDIKLPKSLLDAMTDTRLAAEELRKGLTA